MFELACRDLIDSNFTEQLEKAGLHYKEEDGETIVKVPFFDEVLTVRLPAFSFQSSKGANVTLVAKIIVLHYINNATGRPFAGEKVSFADIPECMHYAPVFEKRVLKPLEKAFGFDRDTFREAGRALGAKEEEYGDASFTIFAFPRVPITFILWTGDEEFPPSAKALFDPSITGYLPFEDIVVISKLASARVLKAARKQFQEL